MTSIRKIDVITRPSACVNTLMLTPEAEETGEQDQEGESNRENGNKGSDIGVEPRGSKGKP